MAQAARRVAAGVLVAALVLGGPVGPLPAAAGVEEEAAAARGETGTPDVTGSLYAAREGQRRLRLDDAITEGLRNNLDVDVERHAPLIAFEDSRIAWGAFDPALDFDFGYDGIETPVASSLQTTARIVERKTSGQAGLSGMIPLWGANYSLLYSGQRLKSTSSIQTLSPEYRSSITALLRAPLLRNLVWSEPWTQVRATRIAHREAREAFREVVMNTVRDIELAYWSLVSERQLLRVARKSLETARALLEQTRAQFEVGVISRVEVTEAEAGVAARELGLIEAENRFRQAQDRLIFLVYGPALEPGQDLEIVPLDRPEDFTRYEADAEVAAGKALDRRPELARAREAIERAEVLLKFARNQRLPQLDVQVSYGFQGLSGAANPNALDFTAGTRSLVEQINAALAPLQAATGVPATALPAPPPPGPPRVRRTYTGSDEDFFDADGAHQFSVRGFLSIPLGNVTARHQVTRADLELRRARAMLRRAEEGVVLEVRDAVRNLASALEGIEAARRRHIAAAEQYRAEQVRLEQGESTPFDTLLREEDLVEAEAARIQAYQRYRDSVVQLERAQGTILESRNIVVEDVERLR